MQELELENNDLLQLWMLNCCAYLSSSADWLIYWPERDNSGPWYFPNEIATKTTIEARRKMLELCVTQGLIEIYSQDSRNNDDWTDPIDINVCEFENREWLHKHEAAITKTGHDLWEDQFSPNWDRYWKIESEEKFENHTIVEVMYNSALIGKELKRWLPAYSRWDEAIGLERVNCWTSFSYQATAWKILPCVKIVSWKGSVDQTSNISHITEAVENGNLSRSDGKKAFTEHIQKFDDRAQAARQALKGFSKWDLVDETTPDA